MKPAEPWLKIFLVVHFSQYFIDFMTFVIPCIGILIFIINDFEFNPLTTGALYILFFHFLLAH